MEDKDKKTLEDMVGFINWSIDNDQRLGFVLSTLGHDIGGILHEEECFCPRTSGYAQRYKSSK